MPNDLGDRLYTLRRIVSKWRKHSVDERLARLESNPGRPAVLSPLLVVAAKPPRVSCPSRRAHAAVANQHRDLQREVIARASS